MIESVELIQRIRDGERAAEAELFERFRRGVAMILRHSVRSPAEAEDLFQETFCRAIEKIRAGEVRDPARLPQFVSALARNLAIDHYRKADRRRTEPDSEVLAFEPAGGLSQYDRVERRERAALTLEVLDGLRNRRDRELLYRFYIAEEDKDEICRALELSSLHFNRVLFRAKQRFRSLFESRFPAACEPAEEPREVAGGEAG